MQKGKEGGASRNGAPPSGAPRSGDLQSAGPQGGLRTPPDPEGGEYRSMVVLGAGIAGLSAALKLARAGEKPLVLEAADQVGGLAATFRTPDFDFDLGGHRWYSTKPEVDAFFKDVLRGELLEVKRYSRIAHGKDRFFQYPIRFADVVRHLGLFFSLRAALSLWFPAKKNDPRRGIPPPRPRPAKKAGFPEGAPSRPLSAEDAYLRNFGKVIYETFFRDYTERLWGIPCSRLDGRWVGQRSENMSFWKILKGFFVKVRDLEAIDSFSYPERGYGRFCERMAEEIERLGGEVRLSRRLLGWREKTENGGTGEGLTKDGGSGGRFELETSGDWGETCKIRCRHLLSTLPLPLFARLRRGGIPDPLRAILPFVRFRDFVVAALHLSQDRYTEDTWLYTQSPGLDFVRLHEPKNWSKALVRKPGSTVLVLEAPCTEGDELWGTDDLLLAERFCRQLDRSVHPVTGSLLGYRILRMKHVYPVYEIGYEEKRQALLDWMKGFEGLELAGRNGLFVYDSSDQPVVSGLAAAGRILEARAAAKA